MSYESAESPFRAPILFWLALVTMPVGNVVFFVNFLHTNASDHVAIALMGLSFAFIGTFFVLNPERVHRIAPHLHGNVPLGISILGWAFALIGGGMAFVSLVLLGLQAVFARH